MRILLPTLLLMLAACEPTPDAQQDLDALDRELTDANSAGNRRDPALAAALEDPLATDPALQQRSNANAVRPTPEPDSGALPPEVALRDPVDPATLRRAPAPAPDCPRCRAKAGALTLGALAERQPGGGRCAAVSYSASWANRLPAGLPLYPDARVQEAAGSDGACGLRVVSFASSAAAGKVVDWYFTRATAAGYSAEHRAEGGVHMLGGTRGNAAYVVYASARAGGGATVDLVTNAGR